MQIPNSRRITVEDYQKDHRDTVSKLANSLNTFMDDVVDLTRKNIGADNLNRHIVKMDITVDGSGNPIGVSQMNIGLKTFTGKNILDIQSLVAGKPNVISAPYIDVTYQGNGIVRINKIYGVAANTKVRIVIEFYP